MSATAFSIHCKRQLTPNKQGDDGWKSVQYEGQPLEYFRRTYYTLMCPEEGDQPEDAAPVVWAPSCVLVTPLMCLEEGQRGRERHTHRERERTLRIHSLVVQALSSVLTRLSCPPKRATR
jgi:hypothetical protein